MLNVDWKIVEAKANELYPRYQGGLKYSELEAELTQQGLDHTHINCIVEEMNKRHLEEKRYRLNLPLALLSVVVAIGAMVGLALVLEKGYTPIAAGVGILVFVVAKMLLRRRILQQRPGERGK